MPHLTTRIIRQEHAALAAMLRSLEIHIQQARQSAKAPDFGLVRAMLFYMDEFPEQRHHRKESELLFPKIRARSLEARDSLDQLDEEHAQGEFAIRRVERALLAYEVMGVSRQDAFEAAVERYVNFYMAHMRHEETKILPLAERVLLPEDWLELDDAFALNRDPLLGYEPDDEYRKLFVRLIDQAQLPRPVPGA